MVCAEPENWCHKIFLCNDSNEAHTVRYIVRDGETREALCMGEAVSPANENVCVGKVKTYSGVQRLIVMEWTLEDGRRGGEPLCDRLPGF